jgi:hypothetical protein
MATYDLSKGGDSGFPAHLKGGSYRLAAEVDFEKTPYASGDVLQLIKLPAQCQVLEVAANVTVPEGAALTATVGDGTDPDGNILSVNLNSVAVTVNNGAYTMPKLYSAADTVDMVLGGDADKAKVTLVVVVRDLSPAL